MLKSLTQLHGSLFKILKKEKKMLIISFGCLTWLAASKGLEPALAVRCHISLHVFFINIDQSCYFSEFALGDYHINALHRCYMMDHAGRNGCKKKKRKQVVWMTFVKRMTEAELSNISISLVVSLINLSPIHNHSCFKILKPKDNNHRLIYQNKWDVF